MVDSSRLLVMAMVAILALGALARALSPTLLTDAPVALALFDGRTASLLLLHGRLDTVTFLIATSIGMSLGDPIAFALGRRHGDKALRVIARWLPVTGYLTRQLERLFGSTRGVPLVLTSGYASCAVAGAAGVSWVAFALFNLASVAVRLAVVIAFTDANSSFFDRVGNWVAQYSTPLTIVTVLLVVLDFVVGRRRIEGPSGRAEFRDDKPDT